MIITHRIALDPNDRQEALLRQHAGYARFAWNWGIEESRRALAAREKSPTSHYRLRPGLQCTETAAGAVVFGTEPERSEVRADRSASDVGQVLASPRGGRQGWSEARAPLPGAALQVTQAGYDLPGGQRARNGSDGGPQDPLAEDRGHSHA